MSPKVQLRGALSARAADEDPGTYILWAALWSQLAFILEVTRPTVVKSLSGLTSRCHRLLDGDRTLQPCVDGHTCGS